MKLILAAVLGLPALLIAGAVAFLMLLTPPACGANGISVNAASLTGTIAGFHGDQLTNAAAIVNAGAQLGVNTQAQTIALMTAIGESGLHNLDHGDAAGPDSLGLFQQRDNGAWGSAADRMNPTTASRNFYRALLAVDGWTSLDPTIAANRVQGNADPYYYEQFHDQAQALMTAFGAQGGGCKAGPPGQVNAQGWARPAGGTISDGYGPRPIICSAGGCSSGFHRGVDLQNPQGSPIYAAHGGVVVAAGPNGTYGNWILIDHGSGISTVYAHMYGDGVYVHPGDQVTAGQNIGAVGCSGACDGPHLHFEVRFNGVRIDPVPFMRAMGVELG